MADQNKPDNSQEEKNTITLLNGRTLFCYPKSEQPDSIEDDEMRLDTTGEYFVIGNKKPRKKVKPEDIWRAEKENLNFFLEHAFFFYQNADRIFHDSRMFLAPVPTHCGLAYTGTSGFQHPTLGIYLEWWINGDGVVTKDKEGNDALTYHVAGSALSGCNSCGCVYPDGTRKRIVHSSFSFVWSTFTKINTRYTEAKQRFDAYSLKEVYYILSKSEPGEASELAIKLMIQERKNVHLLNRLQQLQDRNDELWNRFHQVCIKLHRKELEEFRDEYRRREREVEEQVADLQKQRSEYRAQFKQGLYDKKSYDELVAPLTRQVRALRNQLRSFKNDQINRLLEECDITYGMITEFLNSDKKTEEVT